MTAIFIIGGFTIALGALLAFIHYYMPPEEEVDTPDVPEEPPKPEEPTPMPVTPTPQDKLYEHAKSFIGQELTPADKVPDEVACAEVLSTILKSFLGDFPYIVSTALLYQELRKNPRFKATLELKSGNVIISPTGTGNGTIIGHCGIIGDDSTIMSNDSKTGLWQQNYTINSWITRYRTKGGLKIYVFEPV